jgi:hypothetical protein
MDDIVEKLREAAALSLNEYGEADRYVEAANEIDRLRASLKQAAEICEEIEKLRDQNSELLLSLRDLEERIGKDHHE